MQIKSRRNIQSVNSLKILLYIANHPNCHQYTMTHFSRLLYGINKNTIMSSAFHLERMGYVTGILEPKETAPRPQSRRRLFNITDLGRVEVAAWKEELEQFINNIDSPRS